MPARIVSQALTLGDYAMMAIVTTGTLAMMLAGGLSHRKLRVSAENAEPEPATETPAEPRHQLRDHYRSKWTSDPEPATVAEQPSAVLKRAPRL